MNIFLKGEKLYGEDFTSEEIQGWFEAEREGYADKVRRGSSRPEDYIYDNLHIRCGFKYLPKSAVFENVLGFGSAYGYEFKPIASRIKRLTIIEPSELFVSKNIFNIPTTYIKPNVDGTLPFQDENFDLITCFGVLHHIPVVTNVVGELSRCLRPNSFLLIREPICSQGDWSSPRRGLTANERGIPLGIFRKIVNDYNFSIVSEHLHSFRPLVKIYQWLKLGHPFLKKNGVIMDVFFSRCFFWNYSYHPVKVAKKFTPTAIFFVLRKN